MRRIAYPALPFALVAFAIVSSGCGSSTTTDVTAPTSLGRCQASVQGTPTSFGPAGGTGTVAVSLSRECAWSAASTATWIEITSGREGQGDGSIAYRVHVNSEPVNRSGAISVGERRVDLAQEAAPCRFDVSRPGDSLAPDGGQARVDVSTHQACRWTASTTATWVTLTPPAGTGPGSVQVSASLNPGATRAATVVIAGEPLVFTQPAQPVDPPPPPSPAPNPPGPPAPPPPPPTPGQCSFEIAPAEAAFTFPGGAGSFTLNTNLDCAWSAASDSSWIAITSATSGSGPDLIRYLVLPNASTNSREGAINVGGSTHRVLQSGATGGGDDDDDDEDDEDEDVQLEGAVSKLSGSCPSLRFTVGESIVTTTNQTTFRRGNCSHVENGLGVEVTGRRQPDNSILALSVTLQR